MNDDCYNCKHPKYDHIDWRGAGDKRSNCRVIRCDCEEYKQSLGWSYPAGSDCE